ncbi:hypothetical protein N4G70_35655 [Streptomyces sp. ASQP_92]|uniref:hypothetical protein n=1 Tax=Streptomyces sp. ASQP_92 TaxID=2979116 RepID=UPI0021BF9AB9|nr:hypothetical protein [Streptomyces sp. ASQP_92]MCT9094144.1 hypothetical protein [Streptomyces sp. ASQP_92]
MKKLLGDLGFDNSEALTEFITTRREAEQAALSEVVRRAQVVEERLRAPEAREAQAAARERVTARRSTPAGLGAAGDDLNDAVLKSTEPWPISPTPTRTRSPRLRNG